MSKKQDTVTKKKSTMQFKWTSEMVEDQIKSISGYRASMLYKNLSFAENKSEKYSAARKSVLLLIHQ